MKHLFHSPVHHLVHHPIHHDDRHTPNHIAQYFSPPSHHSQTPFHIQVPKQKKPLFHVSPPSFRDEKLKDIIPVIHSTHRNNASHPTVFHKADIIQNSIPVLNSSSQDNMLIYVAGALSNECSLFVEQALRLCFFQNQ